MGLSEPSSPRVHPERAATRPPGGGGWHEDCHSRAVKQEQRRKEKKLIRSVDSVGFGEYVLESKGLAVDFFLDNPGRVSEHILQLL